MDCDTFVEGDLLVTFPQCKDAEGCNDLFELAADYGSDPVHASARVHPVRQPELLLDQSPCLLRPSESLGT
eukprot:8207547-Alexandrium_andersonii.AAC.1